MCKWILIFLLNVVVNLNIFVIEWFIWWFIRVGLMLLIWVVFMCKVLCIKGLICEWSNLCWGKVIILWVMYCLYWLNVFLVILICFVLIDGFIL